MKFVEWPGHQGSMFNPHDVAAVICHEPSDPHQCYAAEVTLRSGTRVTIERFHLYDSARSAIQAFCERIEEALAIARTGPPIRRCTECGRSLPPNQLADATCDPAGRLTCGDCERSHVARVQAAVHATDSGGRPIYGPGTCPSDYPDPPSCDPFPDERGEQS